MRVVDNWKDASEVPDGEVFVSDLKAMFRRQDNELDWCVEISGFRAVGYFFNEHDAIEYAEFLKTRVAPTV